MSVCPVPIKKAVEANMGKDSAVTEACVYPAAQSPHKAAQPAARRYESDLRDCSQFYEWQYEMRKKACDWVASEGFTLKDALQTAIKDPEIKALIQLSLDKSHHGKRHHLRTGELGC